MAGQYEYRVVEYHVKNYEELQTYLNAQSDDGWDFMEVVGESWYVFRRQRGGVVSKKR